MPSNSWPGPEIGSQGGLGILTKKFPRASMLIIFVLDSSSSYLRLTQSYFRKDRDSVAIPTFEC